MSEASSQASFAALKLFLPPDGRLPVARAVEYLRSLARQIVDLHSSGHVHCGIVPEHLFLDAEGHPQLSALQLQRSLDRTHRDCLPPQLLSYLPLVLPTELSAARMTLEQHGIRLTPQEIDVYQLGALLCRLITGQSAESYRRSPLAKAKVPPELQAILERSLGCAEPRITDAAEFLRLLSQPESAIHAVSSDGRKPDTSPSILGEPPGGDTAIRGEQASRGDSSSDPLPFKQLGHYEILRRIGRGGMGDVYLGYERSLDRQVAIKVLPADLGRSDEFVRRFQAEATAAARLVHPNIIQIYFIGEDAGHRYFAMQYVDGEPLCDLLARRNRLSVSETLDLLEQVLAGLSAAHERGLIHRDIKPANILLDRIHRRALLADFGLVKSLQSADGKTATGVVMGTVDYIAPEQGRGLSVDLRCDLYSVGVLAYQLVSGCLPFEADTPTAMIFQHVYEPPRPLIGLVPDLPTGLIAMVAKLMAKSADARHANAAAVLADVRAIRDGRALPSGADAELRDNPHVFLALPVARSGERQRTAIIQAPTFDDDPRLPASLDLSVARAAGWRDRLKDRWRLFWHSRAPDWLRELQNTQQQVDGAVFEYERRRDRLQSLVSEAEAILSDMRKQEVAWNSDAEGSSHQLAELRRAIAEQDDQLASMRVRLAKIIATLEQLRSQRDLLNARLRVAQARGVLSGATKQHSRWQTRILGAMTLALVIVFAFWKLSTPYRQSQFVGQSTDGRRTRDLNEQKNVFPKGVIEDLQRKVLMVATAPVLATMSPTGYMFAATEAGGSIQLFSYSISDDAIYKGNRLDGVTSEINAAAYSPDVKRLATAHEDGTIRVWDMKANREIRRFPGTSPVTAIVYSQNGEELLSASKDGWIKVWDIQSEEMLREHRASPPYSFPSVLAWNDEESKILTGARLGGAESMAIVDQPTAKLAIEFIGNKQRSTFALAFTADPNQAVSFASDGKFHVWDLSTRNEIRSFGERISEAVLTPDGRRGFALQMATGKMWDLTVWDVEGGKRIASFPNAAASSSRLAISSDGRIGIVVNKNSSLQIFKFPAVTSNATAAISSPPDVVPMNAPVTFVAFDNSGFEGIASAGEAIRRWNIGSPSANRETNIRARVTSVSYSTDDSRVLYTTGQTTSATTNFTGIFHASVLDLRLPRETRRDIRRFEGFASPITAAQFIDSNRKVLTATEAGNIAIWEIQREKEVDHQDVGLPIRAMAYCANRNRAYIVADDSQVHAWNLVDKQESESLQGHSALVRAVAISTDGQVAVTGSDDRTARVWDLSSNQTTATLFGHEGKVTAIAISRDGSRVVTGSDDKTVRIWNARTGDLQHTFRGHSRAVLSVAINPQGAMALSGSDDKTARVWDLTGVSRSEASK